ncbi:hypothetical protein Pint_19209 [Pistacia integerrima]|uniref:Uncharacterized protein n=1 Tax=Pistacia integerrima TaxID=434235 RepID=A0ACC0YWS8_9ROSI|nr:hypothetical protein Pint_19209 [Pistacia integerrima]
MALLSSCWHIIELFIIPDGFVKWFYLSFYIHPIFLFFCQIFLWLKLLNKWILVVFFYPLRIIRFVGLFLFRFFRDFVLIFVFRFSRSMSSTSTNVEVMEEALDENKSLVATQICNQNQAGLSYSCSSGAKIQAYCKVKLLEVEKIDLVEDDDFQEIPALDHEEERMEEPSSCPTNDVDLNDSPSSVFSRNSPARSSDLNPENPQSICISTSPVLERAVPQRDEDRDSADAFYKKYTERMRWFDILNSDRTCGISAVLNRQAGTPSPIESNIDSDQDFAVPNISWSKLTKKRLLKSLESDFEMVYVAQSCLSWEALHYQYTKVKSLAESTSQNGVFSGNVFGEFQKFQVVLERFLEDERCEGKRIWNYVRGRFGLNSLLQVPQISGLLEEESEDMKTETVSVKEVSKAIEKCIQAFGIFVTVDNCNKKPWWKLKTSLTWTYPPVEDPKDLPFLRHLTRKLQKKELCLKDLQGKQRCWIKKVVNPLDESQRKEMLFTMIELKLVSRVLQMSAVSNSQLKWCQEKLDNIEFKEGKVSRASTSPLLFPP